MQRSIILASCIALAFLPLASAQSSYIQPMLTVNWANDTILISIPTTPTWPKPFFLRAITDWDQAQAWFVASYEPAHQNVKYTLQLAEAGQTPQVEIRYVPYAGQDWVALTSVNGREISIVLTSLFSSGDYNLEPVAEHEFGHIFGLADNCIGGDLLDSCGPYLSARYPSTLDLYAVYLQALTNDRYGAGDYVQLPPQIPYSAWNPSIMPIPEFTNPTVVIVAVLSVLVLFRKRSCT